MPDPAQPRPLHGMFTAVPPRYDLINHIITLGMDRRWREAAARACVASSPRRLLDLACGTGDLSIAIARRAKGSVEITGLDYSEPMLEIAREKAASIKGIQPAFVIGDATRLPFPDGYFDVVGISFAFRNLTYHNPITQPALAEVFRVLAPGGRFVIVESSQPKGKIIRWFFRLYLRVFVANAGYLMSGNRSAYKYLAESAARFYTPQEVKKLLMGVGFRDVSYRPLFFGAAGVHVAVK
ncbi:MAG: ubiquinone/menaquinone biosynthesis methyltransferase [Dehalococcoidales bacterium]|nr:ubiquinone/menaquinone biosynthesis methyltransferase [Dehalococcoidales bacterium]